MSRLRFSECPCCLSNNFEYLYANRDKITIASSKDFFYGGRSFISELVGCANCGFHFINNLEENYQKFYMEQCTDDYIAMGKFRKRYFLDIKHIISNTSFFDETNIRYIYDIGCADGIWLSLWSRSDRMLYGNELALSYHAPLLEKGVKLTNKTFPDNVKFDMISMFDFLEHVEDPSDFLADAKRSLNDKGYLLIGVPNMGKLIVKILNSRYYLYCPMHFSYFSRNSLTKLINRIFGNQASVEISSSPPMKTDLQAVARWLGLSKYLHNSLNFTLPFGYSASIIALVRKP